MNDPILLMFLWDGAADSRLQTVTTALQGVVCFCAALLLSLLSRWVSHSIAPYRINLFSPRLIAFKSCPMEWITSPRRPLTWSNNLKLKPLRSLVSKARFYGPLSKFRTSPSSPNFSSGRQLLANNEHLQGIEISVPISVSLTSAQVNQLLFFTTCRLEGLDDLTDTRVNVEQVKGDELNIIGFGYVDFKTWTVYLEMRKEMFVSLKQIIAQILMSRIVLRCLLNPRIRA